MKISKLVEDFIELIYQHFKGKNKYKNYKELTYTKQDLINFFETNNEQELKTLIEAISIVTLEVYDEKIKKLIKIKLKYKENR